MLSEQKKVALNLRVLLFISFTLIVIGLIFIYSASSVFALEKYGSGTYFVKKQILGVFLGFIALIIGVNIPLNTLKKLVPLFFFGSLVLTSFTLLPFLSQRIHGSSRWLAIGGFGFQPSELLKVSLIMYVAYLLDKIGHKKSFFYSFFPILLLIGISAAILLKQPDFGLTVVVCTTIFILLFIAQFKTRYLVMMAMAAIPLAVVLVYFKSYRLKRILTFLNPWEDPQGSGFQIIQSLIAIGSGNWWGMGISNSKQKFFYLPMQHTDFIFSIIAEETGFMGSLVLITLFILFMYFGFKIAFQLTDNFSSYTTFGFIILISLQALINFCVATGLFPTKGMGLPFISYGMSALICNLGILGLIINFVRNNKAKLY